MKDFIFRNDTKLFFRNDIRETILEIVKGHKVMFVYGNGSVKQNGCHADIVQTLTEAGISFVEYGGSSREFAKIEEGIRFAKANGVTMITGKTSVGSYPDLPFQRLGERTGSGIGRFKDRRLRDGIRHPRRLCPALPQILLDIG